MDKDVVHNNHALNSDRRDSYVSEGRGLESRTYHTASVVTYCVQCTSPITNHQYQSTTIKIKHQRTDEPTTLQYRTKHSQLICQTTWYRWNQNGSSQSWPPTLLLQSSPTRRLSTTSTPLPRPTRGSSCHHLSPAASPECPRSSSLSTRPP